MQPIYLDMSPYDCCTQCVHVLHINTARVAGVWRWPSAQRRCGKLHVIIDLGFPHVEPEKAFRARKSLHTCSSIPLI